MYNYEYKVMIYSQYDEPYNKLVFEGEELFENKAQLDSFFTNIKDKRKKYNFVYETYKINYELVDVSEHKDIVCDCD